MSSIEVDLSVAILEDHFGYYVAAVGKLLLSNQYPLSLIIRNVNTRMPSKEVKRSLIIMEQHNLLEISYSTRGGIVYSVLVTNVIRLTRVPRITLIVRSLFGNVGEAIFEEVISSGKILCSECLRRVATRLGIDLKETQRKFVSLLEAQILIRCPSLLSNDDGFPVFEDLTDAFTMPEKIFGDNVKIEVPIDLSQLDLVKLEPKARKRKYVDERPLNADEAPDSNVLWRVNWPRLERFLRDELIVEHLTENEIFDRTAIHVARLLIKVGEAKSEVLALQSQPIALQDVCLYAKSNRVKLDRDVINEKLCMLAAETDGIIRKMGDSGGGLYVINFEKAVELMCYDHIESAIRERFDDVGVRIFRLLRMRGFLEEDQVEKFAMLFSKEAKHVCYSLVDNGFICVRHIAKTNDFAPARTLFLYGIVLSSLISSVVMFTAKAMRNAIKRRNQEMITYEPLIDRQLKMETIVANIECDQNLDADTKKEQMKEVEESYMTAGDKQQIAKYKAGQQMLFKIEVELERVLFLMQQFQRFRRFISLEQMHQRKTRRKPRSILDDFA